MSPELERGLRPSAGLVRLPVRHRRAIIGIVLFEPEPGQGGGRRRRSGVEPEPSRLQDRRPHVDQRLGVRAARVWSAAVPVAALRGGCRRECLVRLRLDSGTHSRSLALLPPSGRPLRGGPPSPSGGRETSQPRAGRPLRGGPPSPSGGRETSQPRARRPPRGGPPSPSGGRETSQPRARRPPRGGPPSPTGGREK